MKWLKNVKLSDLTTMRLGGLARNVAEVESEDDVREAYAFARKNGQKVFVVGGGSNLVGLDEGFDGLIILNKITGNWTEENGIFAVPSGVILDDFIGKVSEQGWSGLEAMAKIPGTIGAAPVQNAGAYGQEIKDVCLKVRCYDTKTDEFVEISAKDCDFAYRRSIFNSSQIGQYFITKVLVKLAKTQMSPPFYNSLQKYLDENHITNYSPKTIFDAVSAVRAAKLPDPATDPSAGSFFKNIQVSDDEAKKLKAKGVVVWDESDGGKNVVPSGWLIEQAGLKGKVFYGFQVSEKATLILINVGAKHYSDLAKARQAISDAVYAKFGLKLEQEPVEIK